MSSLFSRFINRPLYLLVIILVITVSYSGARKLTFQQQINNPRSSFELDPGFKIELIASEPLIADPVDMEIDEYGRLYVVEMHGYPLDKSGSGKIKLVSDSDGDARMDKSIVFADHLTLPSSIMRWKKGVLVTDAPHVLYFEDTNNDGRADIKDTVLTGFALSNPQHNLNSPVLGIDNWIYLAHEGAVSTQTYQKEFGDAGDEIYYPAQKGGPRLPKNASGRSVRFKPDLRLLETTSSNTQFGHTFDSWGRRFLVGNANHIFQEMIAATYLKRNPELLVSNATQSLSDHHNAAKVFPITENPEHQLLTDVGVITSACGVTAYLGGAFPSPFDSVTFVAEPVSNLVHVDRIKENGTTFTASRIHPDKEFLASKDSWFRPVNMYIGPDGALYVVDYYRQIIEHPEWMGEDVVKSGKLYNGSDKGRIYRISAKDAKSADWIKGLKLGDASNEELVQELSNRNIWWRLNAQRLLIDGRDKRVVPSLIKVAESGSSPLGRLHALWTLEGLDALNTSVIEHALKDPVAGIRENAIKLSEPYISGSPTLQKALLSLNADADAKVRYQLLCSLGSINTAEATAVRNDLLFGDVSDEWVQVAALSASSSQAAPLLKVVIDSFRQQVPAYGSLIKRLGSMIAAGGDEQAVHQLIAKAVTPAAKQQVGWQAALLQGISQGLRNKNTRAVYQSEQALLIRTAFEHSSREVRDASLELLKTVGLKRDDTVEKATVQAAARAISQRLPQDRRVEAIRFIGLSNPAAYASVLKKLVHPAEASVIQAASIQALSNIQGNTVAEFLLTKWPDLTPEIRDEAINTFMVSPGRIGILLDALASGKIQTTVIGWPRSVRLMAQSDLKLRERARKLLTVSEDDQRKLIAAYSQSLTLKGAPGNGKKVFGKHCSPCHQVTGGSGVHFGPDLGTVTNWSKEAILTGILVPNLSISSGFDLWAVELKDGTSFQGIIAAETPAAVTLRNAGREERTIKRADVKSLKALNMSSMPAGLEKQINHQEMADLLSFLKQSK
jgi:putative membrane-bound dehydrogenase-like protein